MICKTLNRKSPSYFQLFSYLTKPLNHLTERERSQHIFKHNVYGNTISQWCDQFTENEQFRKLRRKDNTKLIHEIISWAKEDAPHIDSAFIKDFLHHYNKIRADRVMYVAVLHQDEPHTHLHIGMHALNFKTGFSITKKRGAYRSMLQELQAFHLNRYPDIKKSTVDFTSSKEKPYRDKEYQYKRRTGLQLKKDLLSQQLLNIYRQSTSLSDFLQHVQSQDITPYYRRNKLTGVITQAGKKYRFRTLSITSEMLTNLDRQQKTLIDRQQKLNITSPYQEKSDRLRDRRIKNHTDREIER